MRHLNRLSLLILLLPLTIVLMVVYPASAETAEEWYNKGCDLIELGQYKEAIEAYDQALKINPEDAMAWRDKGIALSKITLYKEALEAYDQALKLDPEDVDAWNNKGIALANLGKYEKAIEAYDQAIKINPEDAMAWYNKGVTLSKLGQTEKAIEAYDQAITINPEFNDAITRLNGAMRLLYDNNTSESDHVTAQPVVSYPNSYHSYSGIPDMGNTWMNEHKIRKDEDGYYKCYCLEGWKGPDENCMCWQ